MGNDFEITVVTDDEYWANTKIESAMEEIRRIENLLSPGRKIVKPTRSTNIQALHLRKLTKKYLIYASTKAAAPKIAASASLSSLNNSFTLF